MTKLVIQGGKPVRDKFLVYGQPDVGKNEIDEVVACIESGWLSTGPRAAQFEEDVKQYTNAQNAVATNSCTSALHLSLMTHGIGKGDEVITTPMTFTATVNVIEHVGATPVLADISLDSFNIDPLEIENKITDHTKAIIPVHFAGFPCDMEAINRISYKYNLNVIEDAAHAMGTKYNGDMIGSGDNCTCFSFYVTKNIVAGEGGMVTCGDKRMSHNMRIYGLHGMSHDAWKRYSKESQLHYDVVVPGYKYNMPDINASLAMQQLKKLENFIAERKRHAEHYFRLLKDVDGVVLPYCLVDDETGHRCAWHLYPIMLELEKFSGSREDIMSAIISENIGVATHYRAIFEHQYYKNRYHFPADDYPNAKYVSDRVFSIPLSSKITDKDVTQVVEAIVKVLNHFRK